MSTCCRNSCPASKFALPLLVLLCLLALWTVGVSPAVASEVGIVAAYPFDDGEGSTAADPRGGHDGTTEGAKWVTGKYGTALDFNGEGDCVTVPYGGSLSFENDFTIDGWVRPDTSSGVWPLVSTGWSPNFLLSANSSGLSLFYVAENGSGFAELNGSAELPSNVWSHFAVTIEAEEVKLYVNGEFVESGPSPGRILSAAVMEIGCAAGSNSFSGLIDEIRIYARAISQAEIEEDMETEVGSGAGPGSAAESETTTATSIKTTKATLNGKIATKGVATTYQFEYGTTTSYGATIPVTPLGVEGNLSPVEVSQTPTSLTPDTTYHYRLVVSNSVGGGSGADKTFTTASPPETIIDSGVLGSTNNIDPTFVFHSPEALASFECRMDGGSWAACESSGYTSNWKRSPRVRTENAPENLNSAAAYCARSERKEKKANRSALASPKRIYRWQTSDISPRRRRCLYRVTLDSVPWSAAARSAASSKPGRPHPREAAKLLKIEAANEAEEDKESLAISWIFWVDGATGLPIKASLQEGTEPAVVTYYDYDSGLEEAANLASDFFALEQPAEPSESCISSGQLRGWSYNPAAFVYPDPQFNSVVMTEAGPLTPALGSAIDGYEPRAELTEDGVEPSTAADEEDWNGKSTGSPN